MASTRLRNALSLERQKVLDLGHRWGHRVSALPWLRLGSLGRCLGALLLSDPASPPRPAARIERRCSTIAADRGLPVRGALTSSPRTTMPALGKVVQRDLVHAE